jgi:Mrp family chromosome partitioning ATPase
MGEISEALRRARSEGKTHAPAAEPVPIEPARPRGPVEAGVPDADVAREAPRVARLDALSRTREGLWSPRALFVEDHGAAAESARHLALRVRAELDRRGARSVAVVSALHDEGKTTIAGNLALALCSLSVRRSIALVDLDLRRPSLAKVLALSVAVGIDDVIAGGAELSDACIAFEQPAIDVYPVHKSQPSAHELLVRPGLVAALRELERRYELVVIDTPPVLLVPDTPILLEQVPAALAVARAGRSRLRAFQRMCSMLPSDKLIGAVLDEGRLPTHAASYRYYEQ